MNEYHLIASNDQFASNPKSIILSEISWSLRLCFIDDLTYLANTDKCFEFTKKVASCVSVNISPDSV